MHAPSPLIISVHIPKTAGSSFRDLLIRQFGGRVCLDYDQKPLRHRSDGTPIPAVAVPEDADCAVLHGHFVADRVHLPAGIEPRYAVWLRHPVERVLSHYFFWRREPYLDQPLCRRLIEQDLSAEAFAADPAMRDLQRFFLGDLPAARLAFVGITERFAESIDRFNATFGTELQGAVTANANPEQSDGGYRRLIGERGYDAIAALNPKDMALYEAVRRSYG